MKHFDVNEAAEYLNVHPNTLRKYVHEEGLPVLRFPGRRKWMFRKDLIDGWVAEKSQPQIMSNDNSYKDSNYGRLRVLQP